MAVRDIILKSKEKKSGVQKIMDERQTALEQDYEASKMRRLIAEERKAFREAGEGTLERGKSISVMTHLMNNAQIDPIKAKQFLESLSQEDMNKLSYMMAAEGDRSAAFLNLARSGGTDVKDLVSLIKIVNPSGGGSDSKGILEAVKLGLEVGKGNNPPASDLKEQFETVMSIVNPIKADLEKSRQDLLDEKLESIKASQVNPIEWFKQQKSIAADMGLTAKDAGTSAIDLKLEEMRQSHDLDMERMTWERQKFLLEKDADSEKWGALQETFAPIFQMASPEIRKSIKDLGASVGENLAPKTPGENPNLKQTPPGTAQTANFECPGCKAQLNVEIPPNAPPEIPVKCPNCGVVTPTTIQEVPQTQQTQQTTPPKRELPPRRSGRLKATYR